MRLQKIILLALLSVVVCVVNAQTNPVPYDAATQGLPYFCGFEDWTENAQWLLNKRYGLGQTVPLANNWTINVAAKHSGRNGLYVHPAGNPDVAEYDGSQEVRIIAVREFSLPNGEYDLSFDWRCLGDSVSDAIYVYWLPSTTPNTAFNSVTNSSLPPNVTPLTIAGRDHLSGSPAWKQEHTTITVAGSQNYKLAFVWCNNTTKTYNPGACLDNVWIHKKEQTTDCWKSIDAASISWDKDKAKLTWPASAGANYTIYYWMEGSARVDTIASLTTNTYTFPENVLLSGRYTFAIQVECGDEVSIWTELLNVKNLGTYSKDIEVCPVIKLQSEEGLNVVVPRCDDEEGKILITAPTLQASGGSIAGYHCDRILYNPMVPGQDSPFPFDKNQLSAGELQSVRSITNDDVWDGQVLDLPFGVCFFEGTYRQAVVCANGIVSFDADVLAKASDYALTSQPDIPSERFGGAQGTGLYWKNAIYGVFQDYYPPAGGDIWCGVLGEFPCRKMVVTWNEVPMFSHTNVRNSSMIVMYEGTNIIDVYIKKRQATSWDGGHGIVGVQNADGTDGVAAPHRNVSDGAWSCEYEAWRFSPYTTPMYDVVWYGYEDGTYTNPVALDSVTYVGIDTARIAIDQNSPYKAISVKLTYQACNGDIIQVMDSAMLPLVDTVQVDKTNTYFCAGKEYSDNRLAHITEAGEYEAYDLNQYGCVQKVYQYDIREISCVDYGIVKGYICEGAEYAFEDTVYTEAGTHYYKKRYVDCECDSVRAEIQLSYLPETDFMLLPLENICGDDEQFMLNVKTSAEGYWCSVEFDDKGHKAGFEDIFERPIADLNDLSIPLPKDVRPDKYNMTITLNAEPCGMMTENVEFVVNYPSFITPQKWNDVLAVLSYEYNGHYNFSRFQWYKNGEPIEGATGPYYDLKDGAVFDSNDEYQVGLVRTGENEEILTCPVVPVKNPTGIETVLGDVSNGVVQVYDVLGRLLLEGNHYHINDWLQQNTGVYIVKVAGHPTRKITTK